MKPQGSPLWILGQSCDELLASQSHSLTTSIFVKHFINEYVCFSLFYQLILFLQPSLSWHFCSTVQTLSPAAFACIADLSGLVLELGAALLAALLHSEFRLTRVPTLSVPSVPMSYLDWMSEWKESVPRAAASSRKDDFELSPSWSPQICVNVPLWYLMNSPLISSLLEMKRFFLLFA